jgi:hypothetical protein
MNTLAAMSMLVVLACGATAEAAAGVSGGVGRELQERVLPRTMPGQSVTRLADGRWLLMGGQGEVGPTNEVMLRALAESEERALPATLVKARAWHSATVLPDGTVLILGGIGPNGATVSTAEIFDPQGNTFRILDGAGLLTRSHHTATLMTDGRVFVAGGLSDKGVALPDSELWNPRTGLSEQHSAPMETARFGHSAALLPADPVIVWGGSDQAGKPVKNAEIFSPTSERFSNVDANGLEIAAATHDTAALPAIAATLPAHGASSVPLDITIAVRFSKRLQVESLNSRNVSVVEGGRAVPARVIGAEDGLLLFVTPVKPLLPATHYAVSISGAKDEADSALPTSAFSFTTQAIGTDRSSTKTAGGASDLGLQGGGTEGSSAAPATGLAAANSPSATVQQGEALTAPLCGVTRISSGTDGLLINFDGKDDLNIVLPSNANNHARVRYEIRGGVLSTGGKKSAGLPVKGNGWIYVAQGVTRACALRLVEKDGKRSLYVEEHIHISNRPPRMFTGFIEVI